MGASLFKMAYSWYDSAPCPHGQGCNFIITCENAHLFGIHVYTEHNSPLSNAEIHELESKIAKFTQENRTKIFFDSLVSGVLEMSKMRAELKGRCEFFCETQLSLKFFNSLK